MATLVYSMQFRGQTRTAVPGGSGAAMTAPSCSFVTTIDEQGLHSTWATAPGEDAVFRSRRGSDAGGGNELATVLFGSGHALQLRSVGAALVGPSPDPHLRHGTQVWLIEAGEGQFAGAAGRITSNFFLSDTGELTDHQLGVIFVERPEERGAGAVLRLVDD